MADNESTKIDFDKVESILQEWGTAVGSFEPKKAAEEPTLMALREAGLESGFIASYDKNYSSAKEQIGNFANDIKSAYQAFVDVDEQEEQQQPDPISKDPGGGGGDGGSIPDEELIKLQIAEYEKMSLENLDGVTDELVKLAQQYNITLDELLSNKEYQETLMNILANSTYVPEELKKLILESAEVSQLVLQDIANGKYPTVIGFDDTTKKVYYNYLANIAKANDITLDQLLNDDKYKDILKKSFTTFSSVTGELKGLDDAGITEKLKKIKEGDLSSIDRDAADVLTEYAKLDEKEQVESTKNAGKFGVFAKMNENSSDKSSKGSLSTLYKDYKPEEEKPQGDTDVPTGDTDVPTGDTDVPTGDTDVPTGDTDVPTGDTDVPTGDTDVPTGDTDVPTGDTQTGDTDVPTGQIPTEEQTVPTEEQTPEPAVVAEPPQADDQVQTQETTPEQETIPETPTEPVQVSVEEPVLEQTQEEELPEVAPPPLFEEDTDDDVPTEDIDVPM